MISKKQYLIKVKDELKKSKISLNRIREYITKIMNIYDNDYEYKIFLKNSLFSLLESSMYMDGVIMSINKEIWGLKNNDKKNNHIIQ